MSTAAAPVAFAALGVDPHAVEAWLPVADWKGSTVSLLRNILTVSSKASALRM